MLIYRLYSVEGADTDDVTTDINAAWFMLRMPMDDVGGTAVVESSPSRKCDVTHETAFIWMTNWVRLRAIVFGMGLGLPIQKNLSISSTTISERMVHQNRCFLIKLVCKTIRRTQIPSVRTVIPRKVAPGSFHRKATG